LAQHTTETPAPWLEILRFDWTLLSRFQQRALIGAAVAVAVAVVLATGEGIATHGRVHPGVVVDGVPLGGLSPSDAAARLGPLADTLARRPVRANWQGSAFGVRAASVSFSLDVEGTVDRAYRIGRDRFLSRGLWQRIQGWFSTVTVAPAVRFDRSALGRRVRAIASGVDRPPRDAQVVDIDGHPVAVPSQDGLLVDRRLTLTRFRGALSDPRVAGFTLPLKVIRPRLGTEAARAAAAELDIAISTPVELTYGKHKWVVRSKTIRRWMTVVPRATTSQLDSPLTLAVAPDLTEVQSTIARLTAPIVKPAVDARFDVSGARVRVVPSRTGLAVDAKAASDLIVQQLQTAASRRQVRLSLHAVDPKMTTAAAKAMGVVGRISTFSTQYSSGNAPRASNIHLLASALNNTLIPPGEEFSFNKTIGPRTAAKGYVEAPVIMNGKLVPALGGGICQVGTTIFNAVFFSGLPVVERTNHSFYISHYPDGRDATVSWDGPDFRFKNDTPAWVLIKASWSSDSVTVSLYGTNPGFQVSYATSNWTNRVPFSVQQVDDPRLPKGEQIVEDVGVDGHDVTVMRTVKKGGKVVRKDVFSSHYRSKDQLTRVGTKAPPPPPPPPKPPKPPTPPPAKPTTHSAGNTGGGRH
jgi:vancomycin resistance protein YoaR